MTATVRQAERWSLILIDAATRLDSRQSAACAVFEALQACIGFDKAVLLSFDGALPIGVNKTQTELDQWQARADMYMLELEPLITASCESSDVVCDTEVFSRRERERLEVYGEYFRSFDVCTTLVTCVRQGGIVTQLLALGRCERTGDFSACEVELARVLRPAVSVLTRLLPGVPPRMDIPVATKAMPMKAELSPREHQIVCLLCRGLQNREIAAILGTSCNTVRNQLATIFRKCGVSTRAELVGLAARCWSDGSS